MRVFVTGASGFVGSAVVPELIAAGHQVTGLARSDASARALTAAGADVHRGDLTDLDSLRAGAAAADGVVHLAFVHDFTDYVAAGETDKRAIETLGGALAGTDRPLVVTSGLAGFPDATEDDAPPPGALRQSELAAQALVSNGVRVSVVRLPPSVHGAGDKGFVPRLISIAQEKGVAAYPGEGSNRWSAVHRLDAARLFRLALEQAPAGARVQAIGDDGIAVRTLAEAIGRGLGLPTASIPADDAFSHFGWIGTFFSMEASATSTLTRQRFGWQPTRPGLLDDLAEAHYFTSVTA
ncbi:SDR family oxidoreductase [Mycobacterium sp. NPDC003449]